MLPLLPMPPKRQPAGRPSALVFLVALAATASIASPALGQETEEVAFGALGPHAASVGAAFAGLEPGAVPAPDLGAAETDAALAFVVAVDTASGVVQVLRRADGSRFERRFEAEGEDSYALALVAAELLEVARSGADPVDLGLTSTGALAAVATEEAPEVDEGPGTAQGDQSEARPAPGTDEVDRSQTAAVGTAPPGRVAISMGVGVEAWAGTGGLSPWIVQPTLFLDALWPWGSRLLLGAGVYASAFGSYGTETELAHLDYRRYDVGARATAGLDLSPAGPRLLAHLRLGAGAVVGDGRTLDLTNEERRSETTATWFVGLGVEARQKLIAGLEVYLEVSADLNPSPATFIAFGEPLLEESVVRIAGRLGLGWRIE